MNPLREDTVYTALRAVRDPEINHNVVELGMIREVEIEGDSVFVRIVPTSAHCPFAKQLMASIQAAVAGVEGVRTVEVQWGEEG